MGEVCPGDLVFWANQGKGAEDFIRAVSQSGDVKESAKFIPFHVAIVSKITEQTLLVVNASSSRGIIQESLTSVHLRLSSKSEPLIKLFSVKVSAAEKCAAVSWALSKVGLPYNSVFSENCLNHLGSEAYYCCQLVRKAYEFATGSSEVFPRRLLRFHDSHGAILPYWSDYFAKLRKPVPVAEQGSHPADFVTLQNVEEIPLSREQVMLLLAPLVRPIIVRVMSSFKVPENPLLNLTFIGGRRCDPTTPSHEFENIEPATGKLLCRVKASSEADVNAAVQSGKAAFKEWSSLSGFERGKVLRRAADIIRDNLSEIAKWEVRDNGKPMYEAEMDITGCADNFEYFGGVATTVTGEHIPLSGGRNFGLLIREPLGVCAGIGAWNYPFQTASWKMAPALACGNTFVYKPSPLAPVTSVLLAEILTAAGLPSGALNIVQGEAGTGEALCLNPDVAKVSFTGSVPTGQRIMALCAGRGIKPVTLELGGKSPLIIFEDANLHNAVTGAMMANFFTQGEVCSNAARVFVHESIVDAFTAELVERTRKMRIGNPLEPGTRVGATISEAHMHKVLGYIQSAKDEGGKILCGGERVAGEGFFLSPCVISGATDAMRVAREEIFGSVLLILPFRSEEEAVARANNTNFGLAAGLFTSNLQRAHRVIGQLQAGSIYCNSYNVQPPEIPFGGYKHSGIGRECGTVALQHYSQLKSVYMHMEEELEDCFS